MLFSFLLRILCCCFFFFLTDYTIQLLQCIVYYTTHIIFFFFLLYHNIFFDEFSDISSHCEGSYFHTQEEIERSFYEQAKPYEFCYLSIFNLINVLNDFNIIAKKTREINFDTPPPFISKMNRKLMI